MKKAETEASPMIKIIQREESRKLMPESPVASQVPA
jgi:hypothetical protein